jgi:predicted AlkP superfamily pyrophosphatase or phosphodiesterase
MKNKYSAFAIFSLLLLVLSSCKKDQAINNYKTKNVIIIVIDGPRYSETWGCTTNNTIPNRKHLLQLGVLCKNFFNNGTTLTNPGHTAISTGIYENINNGGSQLPSYPSIFQYYNRAYENNNSYIITSKDKLAVLANCTDSNWKNTYQPKTDCGINGLFTGYRNDSVTLVHTLNTIESKHPRLLLINFKEPDFSGHLADSLSYIEGIKATDIYVNLIWEKLQADTFYKDKTTLIVTNDHGRHLNGIANGFVSHGDNCVGCRHIEFFAIGPDFKSNFICNTSYQQIDISTTIATLLGFSMPTSAGELMKDILK